MHSNDDLDQEAKSISELLEGKCIVNVLRLRIGEVCVECSDGTRFFVNTKGDGNLEFSITGG